MTAQAVAYREQLTDQEVKITPAAHEQMKKLFDEIEDDKVEAIRVYVSGGGCGGMAYGMTFSDGRTEYDRVFNQDGLDVYIDAVAFNYLNGVEIDYVNRPTGSTFVFSNVFQAVGGSGTCGACGMAGGGGCG